jgi:hypothetical protein
LAQTKFTPLTGAAFEQFDQQLGRNVNFLERNGYAAGLNIGCKFY